MRTYKLWGTGLGGKCSFSSLPHLKPQDLAPGYYHIGSFSNNDGDSHCYRAFLKPVTRYVARLARVHSRSRLVASLLRRFRKRYLQSEVAMLETLSRLFHLVSDSSNEGNFFSSWILKGCSDVQQKKKKVALCSRPPQNVKLDIFTCFHVVLAQWRQRNVHKKHSTCKVVVLPILTYCFFAVLVNVART